MRKIITGILAHVDAGKTTLSEAMLYASNTIRKLGRVDHGDSFLDIYKQERDRGITIYSKEARLEYKGNDIVLVDTPGHVDFSAEMERAISAMDVAILVISANEGVQGHTRTLWRLLERYKVPVFVFVNKMDQPGADIKMVVDELTQNLGDGFEIFDDQLDYEKISLYDEAALEYFLENDCLSEECVCKMILDKKVTPVYYGSALKFIGVERFMDGLIKYFKPIECSQEFGAKVYKISRDDKGNVLTHVKITGGSLKVKTVLDICEPVDEDESGEDKDSVTVQEKINQIRLYSGAKYDLVNEVCAPDICVLTGLNRSYVGLCFGAQEPEIEPMLVPILTYKMSILSGQDAAAIMPKIKQLEQEEPGLRIRWNKVLKEINVQLMGEIQTQVLKEIIRERFQLEVEFDKGSIIYKETIGNSVYGVGHFEPLRHYAEVTIRLEPLKVGSGVVIDSDCSEDVLAKNWQRLALTNLGEKQHKGVLTGSNITDIRITLIGGRAHIKHTMGGDFRQASYRAVRQGLMEAKSVLLEPYFDFELKIPSIAVGRAMSDIELMHGSVSIDENDGQTAILTGYAPAVLIRDYHIQVVSYTKGQGSLNLMYRGYAPCHNADEIIMSKRYDPQSDIRNTPDSVFCAHGAGFVVPWNQVKSYMHTVIGEDGNCVAKEKNVETISLSRTVKEYTGSYEEDKELEKIFTQTFGRKEGSDKRNIFANRDSNPQENTKRVPVHLRNKPAKEKYLLVDGYNILFAWSDLNEIAKINVDGARNKLMDILCNYQGYTKCNLIVVFDAYKVKGHKCECMEYNNISVVYTASAQTADSYIEQFTHENASKYDITVATSDRLEQIIIMGDGATRWSARDLENEIDRINELIREKIEGAIENGRI